VAVGVLVLIPFVVARGIFIPNLPDWTVIAWLMSCAIAALVAYHLYRHHSRVVRRVLTFSYILYSGLAWLVMLDANSVQTTAITLFGLAGFGLAVSYVVRMPYLQLLFSTFVVFAVVTLAQWWSIDLSWRALFVGGTVALVCWVLSFVQVVVVQLSRARISIGSGQVALLIVLGAYMSFAHNFEVTVAVGTLLLAAIVSVGLRALWRIDAATSRMFIWSYTTYAVMAVAGAALIDTALCALVAAVALVLSLVVSYIERLPVVQLASAGLTIVFVAAMADSLNVASGWQLLTTFGVSSLLLYAGALVHASYGQLARRTVMVATGQATLLMMVFAGTSANHVAVKIAFVTMVVASIGSLLLYWRSRDSQSPLKLIWMYSYVLYFVAGLMVSAALAPVWGIAALLMGSVLFWLASYAERSSFIMAIGNAVFVMALVRLWGWMEYSELWMIFGVGWTAAGLFYGVGWLIAAGGDTARRRIMLLSTWIVLATVTLIGAGIATMEIATAATLGVLAVTVGVDAYVKRKFGLVEAMVHVLTFSLQRIVSEVYPDLNAVAYAHWWAVVIVVIALLRHQYKRRRLITATAIVTAATGVYAIIYGGNYQLLFLVEHIALLIAGALTARSWATWWGVGAVALSVLYFLRGYTFVLLGLLGLMMIGIVVWRLLRSDRSNPNQHQ
ncbi:MAG: hypothetical protein ABIR91_03205, partial [Candidatus Saccharimonadales bacterium]